MLLNITPFVQQIFIDSMRDRIHRLYKMSEAYRDGDNKEAQWWRQFAVANLVAVEG